MDLVSPDLVVVAGYYQIRDATGASAPLANMKKFAPQFCSMYIDGVSTSPTCRDGAHLRDYRLDLEASRWMGRLVRRRPPE